MARISKGRTIKELVIGVLGVPSAFTIVWFSIFGLSVTEVATDGEQDTAPGVAPESGPAGGEQGSAVRQ
nr:BCCT family transporter [Haloechinothrix alba]